MSTVPLLRVGGTHPLASAALDPTLHDRLPNIKFLFSLYAPVACWSARLPAHLSTAQCTADFPAGTLLGGQYEVVSLLGRGGNGVTYLCRDATSGKDVAVKCLSLRRWPGQGGGGFWEGRTEAGAGACSKGGKVSRRSGGRIVCWQLFGLQPLLC